MSSLGSPDRDPRDNPLRSYLSISSGRLSAAQWRDLFVFGISTGSMYALIALGYTMVYGVLRFINFAHGEVFMVGEMMAFYVANALAVPHSGRPAPRSLS